MAGHIVNTSLSRLFLCLHVRSFIDKCFIYWHSMWMLMSHWPIPLYNAEQLGNYSRHAKGFHVNKRYTPACGERMQAGKTSPTKNSSRCAAIIDPGSIREHRSSSATDKATHSLNLPGIQVYTSFKRPTSTRLELNIQDAVCPSPVCQMGYSGCCMDWICFCICKVCCGNSRMFLWTKLPRTGCQLEYKLM
jgi:hypothetical protein